MGVALGPCLMGDADAGLVRLLPELELVGPEVWLLVHGELAELARVRVVLDVLAKCARAGYRTALQGGRSYLECGSSAMGH